MTNPNTTHITLVCDRTGSMSRIQTDAEGAVNTFIKEQKAEPGECSFLLIDFDAVGEWETRPGIDYGPAPWYRVVYDGPMTEAPEYRLQPRGNTALFDAIGTAIVQTGERLSSLPEDQRPGRVIFVFQTDGMENSSREWTGERMRDAIKHQEDEYGWVFLPLGVGPDAFSGLSRVLVGTQSVSNITRTGATGMSASAGYGHTNDTVRSMRSVSHEDYLVMSASSHAADVDDQGNVTTTPPRPKSKSESHKK